MEILLVALLAVQTARFVWIVAEPALPLGPAVVEAPRANDTELASLTRTNPFEPRLPAAGASAAADGAGLSLFGIRTAGLDGGSAIIGVSGAAQAVYAVGEEIAPGTALASVAADHVVLSRGGRMFELRLSDSSVTQTGAGAIPSYLAAPKRTLPAATPSAPIAIDPKKFLAETGLRPRTENGHITGYTVLPRGGAETLRQAGLQAGDVLVAVNGSPISPELYSGLERELANEPQARITIQRGSETKIITLQTGR